ncbi:calmin [Bombina bombina]|uniref:calmin n=1 Tax=Bombina bombina TaxID=8345 RepID=UPI00235B172D|nr:calmin [Bombina bombina]
MAGHEWDWFQREELIGQISDIRVQNLQVERENVQKRTFTRWVNLHLEKCNPPLEVKDLFVDIQDGKVLMALIEVLTGQNLLHEYKSSTHRIFRLNNIAKALKFLEDSNVKLVSIDAAEIADGNPSLVLGLIWNIILFLQIKELTGNLNRMSSSSSLSSMPSGTESDTSNPSTPSVEKSMSVSIKDQRKAIKALLNWVQQRTRKYGVAVQDFAGSWRSGLAFLAVIKAIDSNLVDIRNALTRSSRENLEDAFTIAQKSLGIPRLLEPEDLMVDSPDEQSIMTYVTQFLEHFPDIDTDDLIDQNEELPVESTYVHYKDGPTEEEGKIIILNDTEDVEAIIEDYKLNSQRNFNYQSKPSTEYEQILLQESEINTKPNRNFIADEKMFTSKSEMSEEVLTKKITESDKVAGDKRSGVSLLLENGKYPHNYQDPLSKMSSITELNDPKSYNLNSKLNELYNNNSNSSSIEDISTDFGNSSRSLVHESKGSIYQSNELLSEDQMLYINGDQSHTDKTSKNVNVCKYVTHPSNKNTSESDPLKQRTVFQAYRATIISAEDELEGNHQDSKSNVGHPQSSLSLPNSKVETDPKDSGKVSVIPHDLFYYPHYSVPIADVLHAFTETCPDGSKKREIESGSIPSSRGNDLSSNKDGEEIQAGFEITKNLISWTKPDDYMLMMKDKESDGGYPQSSSKRQTLQFDQVPSSSITKDQTMNIQAGGVDSTMNFDYAKDIQGFAVDGINQQKIKSPLRSDNKRAELEETNFQVIKEVLDTPAIELKEQNLLRFRASQRDTKLHCKVSEHIPEQTNRETSTDKNVCRDSNDHIRKNGFSETYSASKKATSRRENRFPDMYYTAILILVVIYCILILPELDIRKVTFFANNK